jgi:hypothetical protein
MRCLECRILGNEKKAKFLSYMMTLLTQSVISAGTHSPGIHCVASSTMYWKVVMNLTLHVPVVQSCLAIRDRRRASPALERLSMSECRSPDESILNVQSWFEFPRAITRRRNVSLRQAGLFLEAYRAGSAQSGYC